MNFDWANHLLSGFHKLELAVSLLHPVLGTECILHNPLDQLSIIALNHRELVLFLFKIFEGLILWLLYNNAVAFGDFEKWCLNLGTMDFCYLLERRCFQVFINELLYGLLFDLGRGLGLLVNLKVFFSVAVELLRRHRKRALSFEWRESLPIVEVWRIIFADGGLLVRFLDHLVALGQTGAIHLD